MKVTELGRSRLAALRLVAQSSFAGGVPRPSRSGQQLASWPGTSSSDSDEHRSSLPHGTCTSGAMYLLALTAIPRVRGAGVAVAAVIWVLALRYNYFQLQSGIDAFEAYTRTKGLGS